mgnify:CR=1 FL=1
MLMHMHQEGPTNVLMLFDIANDHILVCCINGLCLTFGDGWDCLFVLLSVYVLG